MDTKAPAFMVYPKDFLSDEKVELMTNQEVGCYWKLLCRQWLEGSIPADIPKIAKLVGEDGSAMAQLWTAIGSCFVEAPGKPGRLVNARLEEERRKQELHRKERSQSGSKGAKARWEKRSGEHTEDGTVTGSANGSAIEQPKANDSIAFAFASSNKDIEQQQKREPPWSESCMVWRNWYEKRFAMKRPREENGNMVDAMVNEGMSPMVVIFVIDKLIGKANDPLIYGSSVLANLFAAGIRTEPELMAYLEDHPEVMQVGGRGDKTSHGTGGAEAQGNGAERKRRAPGAKAGSERPELDSLSV